MTPPRRCQDRMLTRWVFGWLLQVAIKLESKVLPSILSDTLIVRRYKPAWSLTFCPAYGVNHELVRGRESPLMVSSLSVPLQLLVQDNDPIQRTVLFRVVVREVDRLPSAPFEPGRRTSSARFFPFVERTTNAESPSECLATRETIRGWYPSPFQPPLQAGHTAVPEIGRTWGSPRSL